VNLGQNGPIKKDPPKRINSLIDRSNVQREAGFDAHIAMSCETRVSCWFRHPCHPSDTPT